jgi:beta-lactamase regulating signal transducer with metallopeptidase domain
VEALFRIALSNAVAATILALAALLVSRVCRRPALTHALWLLVLVKLITPPLRAIEFDWPGAQESGAVLASAPHAAIADLPEEFPTSDMQPDAAELEMTSERIEIGTPALACQEPAKTVPELDNAAEGAEPVGSAEGSFLARIPWSWALGVGWLIGSGAWLALLVSRTWRFHRLLQPARRARPALQEEVNQLARSLGLARSPEVWLIPGRISPMVWALALRPRIYLPVELWAALDDDQRRALLLHELAHLRRGDHWVRALEIVTTCLFWWHPVVWWAQRELREAEEQCCDAWVLWAMPGAARRYALALVETLDFLSEAQPALARRPCSCRLARLSRRRRHSKNGKSRPNAPVLRRRCDARR